MKTLKILGLLLLIFNFQTGFSQVDLFTDDEDEDDNQEITYKNFMNKLTGILKQGEASPIGNWAGETLEIMTDSRFADAPQEYLMAFQVRTKVLKIQAFDIVMEKATLTCEERKKLCESYLLFLGTIYLDIYSMDFFNEKKEYTYNETMNAFMGACDAETKFTFGVYDRSGLWSYVSDLSWSLNDEKFYKDFCLNDTEDPNVTDCNWSIENELYQNNNLKVNDGALQLNTLHPENILKKTVELQNLLASLPCNKP